MFFSLYLLPPAESQEGDLKRRRSLLSAALDNLSLWGSLIIHASLTGYLLSFCISLLKGMREVESYVAIINFPVTQQWHFHQAECINIQKGKLL